MPLMGNAATDGPAGWGRVNMQGAILATACAIATQSSDQTIDMATMSASQLMREGKGERKPFEVRLIHCTLAEGRDIPATWQNFQITFDGQRDTDLFGITGQAKGLALEISDDDGKIALPGVPFSTGKIKEGDMVLNYNFRVVSNRQHLQTGEYYSTVRFNMNYY
ncbi:type 1 fimbrial protein [Serratia proteamaculans]|nr:type 1 fimbrial protein [Serratia proteamaculans]